ncbi:MAG: BamA/TamA family outer membrane protein [Novosphingobium sp.]|nr:BamA/TamA family outer membrane protein [Novosphingobium sp.]
MAQEAASSPHLEDLIPDSAVDDPQSWAGAAVAPEGADEAPLLDAGAPLADMPDVTVPWPDETEFARPQPLEPDAGDALAAEAFEPLAPLPEGKKERLSSELMLVFPHDEEEFPIRKTFVDRFDDLSNIDGLANGKGNLAQIAARARQDEKLLVRLLRNYGYYDGQVLRTVSGGDEDDSDARPNVRFDILPGAQYHFGAIDLGDLSQAPDHVDLRWSFNIWPGEPLVADKIVEENYHLDQALGESGYPFAKIGDPELVIDHDRLEGDLTLPVAPGGKYRFGAIVSKMPKFLSGRHLQQIARFKPGDTYRRSDEMDLRRAIIATGLVSSVSITPRAVEAPSAGQPGTVDMDVELTKAPLRTISGAVGYGTGEGFRVEASWEHRNFFPPEGALRIRGVAGTREQLAGITFRRNNFHGRDRILTLDTYANTVEQDAYDAQTVSAVATYERVSTLLFQKPFTWSVGVELLATAERPPKVDGVKQLSQTYFITALPLGAGVDTSDDLLNPTKGFRASARLSPELSVQNGTKSTYLRSQFDLSGYLPLGDKVVLAGRTRLGSIIGAPVDDIALSRRLYAGGGGSVRGYGYQQVGPRNADGDPNGGRSLIEFSLEARVKTGMFGGAMSVVPFVDAGAVDRSSTPGFGGMKFGAGLGVRYQTNFGPIRLDVATPLNPGPGDGPVAVYVGLGQAF